MIVVCIGVPSKITIRWWTCCCNYTALHTAAEEGNIECVKLLLDCPGLLVNKETNEGYTAIAMAVYRNQKSVVELLIRDPRTDLTKIDGDNLTLVELAE